MLKKVISVCLIASIAIVAVCSGMTTSIGTDDSALEISISDHYPDYIHTTNGDSAIPLISVYGEVIER
jgi:hypothetical protein